MYVKNNVKFVQIKEREHKMGNIYMPYVTYAVIRKCMGTWQLQDHITDFHNIMFIASGECDLYIDGMYHRLRAGDVSYYPKGTWRRGGNSTEDAVIYAFDFELFGEERLELGNITHIGNIDSFLPCFKDFFSAWYQKYDGYELFCSGIFAQILSKILYPHLGKTANSHVLMMREYIVEHLGEQITVEDLARVVNLSPIYCGSLFAKKEGVTIHEYINIMRINKAKDLLVGDPISVSETACAVGFSDLFYFCKVFKRLTGMTPTEYRRSYSVDSSIANQLNDL